MKENIKKLFAIFLFLSLFGGFLVFLGDILGVLIGGEKGAFIISFTKSWIMMVSTIFATLSIIFGIVFIYITKTHSLNVRD